MPPWLRQVRDDVFGADLRSLAVLRMGMGAILLLDLAIRSLALRDHYTDSGVIPRDEHLLALNDGWLISLHALSGGIWLQVVLFLTAAVFATMLMVGWRTRLATAASFLLLCSLHGRAPNVLQAGDNLLRVLLLWGTFLPLGARSSLDARAGRAPHVEGGERVVSWAVAGLYLQICLLYYFAFLFKSGSSWQAGLAIEYVLRVEPYVTSLGTRLLAYPLMLRILTLTTLLVELVAPFLLLFPRLTGAVRVVTVAILATFHLGLGVSMNLPLFAAISITALVAFLPGGVWDALGWSRRRALDPSANAPPRWGVPRPLPGVLGVAAISYTLLWNVAGYRPTAVPWFEHARWIGRIVRVDQNWSVFAPELPTQLDGWFVFPATLRDGRRIDLRRSLFAEPRTAMPVVESKPADGWRYPNFRWVTLMLEARAYEEDRAPLARWLCREWNAGRPETEHAVSVEIVFFQERPLLDRLDPPIDQIPLWTESCVPVAAGGDV